MGESNPQSPRRLRVPIVDVPPTHPIFRTFAPVGQVPQVTNIQFWRGSGGTETSERGADSAEVHARAISDARGRIMVLMTHNTDLGDSWEREGEDPVFSISSPRPATLSASTCSCTC